MKSTQHSHLSCCLESDRSTRALLGQGGDGGEGGCTERGGGVDCSVHVLLLLLSERCQFTIRSS
jgi:hypothetical protein